MRNRTCRAVLPLMLLGVMLAARPALALSCDTDIQCEGDDVCQNHVCVDLKGKSKAKPNATKPPPDSQPPATTPEATPAPAPAPAAKPAPPPAPTGTACARDLDCPGDEECVERFCRSARERPGSSNAKPSPSAPAPAPAPVASATPSPRRGPSPAAEPFGAPAGAIAMAVFGNLGLFIESFSGSSTAVHIGISGDAHITYGINYDLALVGIGELGFVVQDSGLILPLTVAGAIAFEHVGPLKVLGGLGLTVAPYFGGPTFAPGSFVGPALIGEAIYPVAGTPLGVKGRLSIHPLSNGMLMFVFTAGAGYQF